MSDDCCLPMTVDLKTCSPSLKKGIPHESQKYPFQLLKVLDNMRKTEELSDVVIVVGSSRICAHRVILSGASPYFRVSGILRFRK